MANIAAMHAKPSRDPSQCAIAHCQDLWPNTVQNSRIASAEDFASLEIVSNLY